MLAFTSVTPNKIAQGVSNRSITLHGGGFLPGATVTTGKPGLTINSVNVAADGSTITAKLTASNSATTGAASLTVTQPGGTVTCSGCVTVQAPPTVSGISPNTLGQGAKNVDVTASGTGFTSPVTVTVPGSGGGITTTTTVTNATTLSIKTTVAASTPTGTYDVHIANGNGSSVTCSGCLTIVAGPTVSSISPTSAARHTTQAFTVNGTGFSSDATVTGPTGVTFSGLTVSGDGLTITGTMTVATNATLGANQVVTVTNGPLGSYGRATLAGLTITKT